MSRTVRAVLLAFWISSAAFADPTAALFDGQSTPAESTTPPLDSAVSQTTWHGFPPVPPPPDGQVEETPVVEELWEHGGSYLYQPEGDRLGYGEHAEHSELLRLPDETPTPRPWTAFQDFLGADPIGEHPQLHWPGPGGYAWEPRFVAYGSYQVFGILNEQGDQRRDGIGHQLLVDLDLRVTGTERAHMQFRPLGRRNSGGSFYQFSDPPGYVDNSTAEPDRYWIEGELHSLCGAWLDPFAVRDIHVVAGRFPVLLHNTLLINDDVLGVAINKNTLFVGPLSNVNLQALLLFEDVNTYSDSDSRMYGLNAFVDHQRAFYELSYAFVDNDARADLDLHYIAMSRTALYGPWNLAVRGLYKFGSRQAGGNAQLLVLESNRTVLLEQDVCGVHELVWYANAFGATSGWTSISGMNFDRLRASFEVNPLVQLSAARQFLPETWGVSGGVQMFRHHQDESLTPEIAFQSLGGTAVWAVGCRYLRKTGSRTFFEVLGVANFSDDHALDREGLFVAHTILF